MQKIRQIESKSNNYFILESEEFQYANQIRDQSSYFDIQKGAKISELISWLKDFVICDQ
jgi:hypothetical protein